MVKRTFLLSFALSFVLPALAGVAYAATSHGAMAEKIRQTPSQRPTGGAVLARFSCGDSDGGKNQAVKGTVTVRDNVYRTNKSVTDTCVNQTTVLENYCASNRSPEIKNTPIACQGFQTCYDGACVQQTLTVSKNTALADFTAQNPTGVVGSPRVKVASLVLTTGKGEVVNVSQIILEEATPGFCLGSYLKNLTLTDARGNTLGNIIPSPSQTCVAHNLFTFDLNPKVSLAANSSLVFDVYADLVSELKTPTALVGVNGILATGQVTLSDLSIFNRQVTLQTQVIAPASSLTVTLDPVDKATFSATDNNFLFGAVNTAVARFVLAASSSSEDVIVHQLVVSSAFTPWQPGTTADIMMQNIRLIDVDTANQVGPTVPFFSDTVNGQKATNGSYLHATFSNLNFIIPKGRTKKLAVVVDFIPYANGNFNVTGQTITPTILNTYTGNAGDSPVKAVGASSNTPTQVNVDDTIPAGLAYQIGVVYRAKLATAWAADTPQGHGSPSASQLAGKFVVSNLANSGAYLASINTIDFTFLTTIASSTPTCRAATLYKDSLASVPLYVGPNYFCEDSLSNPHHSAQSFVRFFLTNQTISAGASKTFYVTVDSTDARPTDYLSVSMPRHGINWGDGISSSITAMGADLPLRERTITY